MERQEAPAAIAWARQLAELPLQQAALIHVSYRWLEFDPKGALAYAAGWIRQSLLSDEEKARLLAAARPADEKASMMQGLEYSRKNLPATQETAYAGLVDDETDVERANSNLLAPRKRPSRSRC